MLIEPHPQMRVQVQRIGTEGAPLLVVDQLVADPERLVRKATRMDFSRQGEFFPGIRARAPASYEVFLERLVQPLLVDVFGLQPGRLRFPTCHYSLITQAPEKLVFLQRIPHIDSASALGLPAMHYLFRGTWCGTGFYRHRASGVECAEAGGHDAYYRQLQLESEGPDAPG